MIALAALSAMAGAGAGAGAVGPMEFTLKHEEWKPVRATYTPKAGSSSGSRARGRVGGNQRQRRKDRRRAHAAGSKHAFR